MFIRPFNHPEIAKPLPQRIQIVDYYKNKAGIKGGYLDCSHLAELEYIYISLKFIWKKSSRIKKKKKLRKKKFFFFFWMGVPLKGYVASLVIFRFGARNKKKKVLWEYPVTNDA